MIPHIGDIFPFVIRHGLAVLANLAVLFLFCGAASAQNFVVREFRIPIKSAGSKGLEALLIRPNDLGPHPLALITHGTPRDPNDRAGLTAMSFEPQAYEFARRGWTAVVVLRRGFGDSGGGYNEDAQSCAHPDYLGATNESIEDLRDAIAYLSRLSDVDPSRIIGVGVSTGGLAMVGLTASPPLGFIAGINFAGGRGSQAPDQVCDPDALVGTFAHYGKHSRTPMLWIYSENDHFFSPHLAHRFYNAFTEQGGMAKLIMAPGFRRDGHGLFSLGGAPVWAPMVDEFLKAQNLELRDSLLPLPAPPPINPPDGFPERSLADFRNYLILPSHKALAISERHLYGYSSGRRTEKDAEVKALDNCKEVAPKGDRCHIAMIDDRTLAVR